MLKGIDLRAEMKKQEVAAVKKKAEDQLYQESNGIFGKDLLSEIGIAIEVQD